VEDQGENKQKIKVRAQLGPRSEHVEDQDENTKEQGENTISSVLSEI